MIINVERLKAIKPFIVMELLARAKELEEQGRDIIHMEIGEPDFPTPPAVIEAGVKMIRSGSVKYTAAAGLTELRKTIAHYCRDRYGVDLFWKRIFITPGASGAFLLGWSALLNQGDEILLADPGYPCNRNFIHLFGGAPKLIPVDAATHFQLNQELVQKNWSSRTQGILLASPANPTGTLIEAQEMKAICAFIRERAGFLISDEIYHGLEYDQRAVSALEFSQDAWIVNSFSKYFGMTGWRIGWLIVPELYVEAVEKIAQTIFISAPAHSQYAALAAFDSATFGELERRRRIFQARRDFLFSALQKLGFSMPVKPAGAFYLYADSSRFSDNSYRFARALLEDAGVAVTPGTDFGEHAANTHVRFAYTTSMERLVEGVERIGRFVSSLDR